MSTPTAPPLSDVDIALLRAAADRLSTLDCRSSACRFASDKSGQRTNGRCRCLDDGGEPGVGRAVSTVARLLARLCDALLEARRERDAALRHAAEWQERLNRAIGKQQCRMQKLRERAETAEKALIDAGFVARVSKRIAVFSRENYAVLKGQLATMKAERDAAREEGRREERAAIHAIVTAAALSSPDYAVSGRGLLAELERRGHVAGGSGGQR